MILYDDKMLLLLNVNVSNYIICNIHLRPRYYKHKSECIWIRILIFVIVFFYMNGVSVHMKTNESADRETASFLNCSPQCLFAVHHGNSLVYAFAEVSIEQWRKTFFYFVCKFLPSQSNRHVFFSEWMYMQVWICLVDAHLPNDNVLMFELIHPFFGIIIR